MPEIVVTPVYAALIAVLMAILSTMTGLMRGKTGVLIGHGDNDAMHLAMRRFGNLSEYAAMAVLILLLMELRGVPAFWLHAYGAVLVALRLLHPFVLFDARGTAGWKKAGRLLSAAGTAALLAAGAVTLLVS